MISRRQVLKSIGLALLGGTPGAIFWGLGGGTQGLVLCGLGLFIGFAFSLPGISPSRVARLTAGTIVAHNVPGPLKHQVMDHFLAETEDYPPAPPDPPESETVSHHDPVDRAM
jgi:hypothetical protein